MRHRMVIAALSATFAAAAAFAQAPAGTAFTYQGRLDSGGIPVTGFQNDVMVRPRLPVPGAADLPY